MDQEKLATHMARNAANFATSDTSGIGKLDYAAYKNYCKKSKKY